MRAFPSGEVNKDIRRILGVTLRLVEEGLDDLLAQRDREGILYRVQDDLPATIWQKVRVLAEKALYLVDDMATRYQLQQEVTQVSQLLHARSPLGRPGIHPGIRRGVLCLEASNLCFGQDGECREHADNSKSS